MIPRLGDGNQLIIDEEDLSPNSLENDSPSRGRKR